MTTPAHVRTVVIVSARPATPNLAGLVVNSVLGGVSILTTCGYLISQAGGVDAAAMVGTIAAALLAAPTLVPR